MIAGSAARVALGVGVSISLVAATGCHFHDLAASRETLRQTEGRLRFHDDGAVRGVAVDAAVGTEAIRATAGLVLDSQLRDGDPEHHLGVGARADLRFSIFGILSSNRSLDHWVDPGLVVGVAGGAIKPSRLEAWGDVHAGLSLDIGLMRGDRVPVLTFELMPTSASGTWHDDVVLSVGLAWRARRIDDYRRRWRD